MTPPRRRVVQCSLGNVGSLNLPLVLDRPELDLVGVWCHTPEKHGQDVGPLVGRDPVGVRVVDRFEEIVEIDADCALYHSQILEREDEAIAEIAQLLRSGTNVIVPWISALQWPHFGRAFAPQAVADVEAACADGDTSLFMTGTDPGFFSDVLPVVLTGVCGTVESVRLQEVLDYSPFDDPRLTAPDFLCFGRPLEHADPNFVSEQTIEQGWGATAALTAAALGFEVVSTSTFERTGAGDPGDRLRARRDGRTRDDRRAVVRDHGHHRWADGDLGAHHPRRRRLHPGRLAGRSAGGQRLRGEVRRVTER